MKKIYYPYGEFILDLKELVKKIDQEFDTIIGIARGGLSMAQLLGEYYDIREVYAINSIGYEDVKKLDEVRVFNIPDILNSKRVLIVDDIADSGETLLEVMRVLKKAYPDTLFDSATIFYKPTALIEPTWWVKKPEGWIEFFWSEDLKN